MGIVKQNKVENEQKSKKVNDSYALTRIMNDLETDISLKAGMVAYLEEEYECIKNQLTKEKAALKDLEEAYKAISNI